MEYLKYARSLNISAKGFASSLMAGVATELSKSALNVNDVCSLGGTTKDN